MMAIHPTSQTAVVSHDAEMVKRHLVRWFLAGGLGFQKTKDAIGNEVLFSRNWRRADLLLLSDEFHAIEVKSDADSLARLEEQLADYHRVFDKVSVATTRPQLRGVQQTTARRTGIILLDGDQLEIVRRAKVTMRLDKLDLSRFLDKDTLTRILGSGARARSSDTLRQELASRLSTKEIRRLAYDALRQRYTRLFELFLSDVGDRQFGEDELRGLCGSVNSIKL